MYEDFIRNNKMYDKENVSEEQIEKDKSAVFARIGAADAAKPGTAGQDDGISVQPGTRAGKRSPLRFIIPSVAAAALLAAAVPAAINLSGKKPEKAAPAYAAESVTSDSVPEPAESLPAPAAPQSPAAEESSSPEKPEAQFKEYTVAAESVDFKASVFRTKGNDDEAEYPFTFWFPKKESLLLYCEDAKDKFDLSDNALPDALSEYDEAFFETHDLLIVVVEEPDSTSALTVAGVDYYAPAADVTDDFGYIVPKIRRDGAVPADRELQPAQWHIVIELEKGMAHKERWVYPAVYEGEYTQPSVPTITEIVGMSDKCARIALRSASFYELERLWGEYDSVIPESRVYTWYHLGTPVTVRFNQNGFANDICTGPKPCFLGSIPDEDSGWFDSRLDEWEVSLRISEKAITAGGETLFSADRIKTAFFADISGDKKRELCVILENESSGESFCVYSFEDGKKYQYLPQGSALPEFEAGQGAEGIILDDLANGSSVKLDMSVLTPFEQ